MKSASFVLYSRSDEPIMTVVMEEQLDEWGETEVIFGTSLLSESDKFSRAKGEDIAVTKLATEYDGPSKVPAYRTSRAIRRIHELCEEDFLKYMCLCGSVPRMWDVVFPAAGVSFASIKNLIKLFNE